MSAIERIQGFACEVTQEEWEELVRVADSVGLAVDEPSRRKGTEDGQWNIAIIDEGAMMAYNKVDDGASKIPYLDFLSKLKGEEKWEPKNGDCVEVSNDDFTTCVKGSYIGVDKESGYHVIRLLGYIEYISKAQVRQFIPTITRQEAEALLNKQIID